MQQARVPQKVNGDAHEYSQPNLNVELPKGISNLFNSVVSLKAKSLLVDAPKKNTELALCLH